MGRLQASVATFKIGPADEILLAQLLEPLEVRSGQIPIALGCDQRGPRSVDGKLVILRVQLRQYLPSLDALAQFNLARDDLAPHSESEARLHSRTHLAREFGARRDAIHAYGDQFHGADRLIGLHRALFFDASPAPTKFAMAKLGVCTEDVRLPITPCADAVRPQVLEAMRAAGLNV